MAANKNDGGDLGRVQLRGENGEIILIPKPSSDPNDPLNWSVEPLILRAVKTKFKKVARI